MREAMSREKRGYDTGVARNYFLLCFDKIRTRMLAFAGASLGFTLPAGQQFAAAVTGRQPCIAMDEAVPLKPVWGCVLLHA